MRPAFVVPTCPYAPPSPDRRPPSRRACRRTRPACPATRGTCSRTPAPPMRQRDRGGARLPASTVTSTLAASMVNVCGMVPSFSSSTAMVLPGLPWMNVGLKYMSSSSSSSSVAPVRSLVPLSLTVPLSVTGAAAAALEGASDGAEPDGPPSSPHAESAVRATRPAIAVILVRMVCTSRRPHRGLRRRRTGIGNLVTPPARTPGVGVPSDESLVAGVAAGDEDAMAALVRRYQARVYGLARTVLGDASAAEDVAQEAFVRLWRHAEAYDAPPRARRHLAARPSPATSPSTPCGCVAPTRSTRRVARAGRAGPRRGTGRRRGHVRRRAPGAGGDPRAAGAATARAGAGGVPRADGGRGGDVRGHPARHREDPRSAPGCSSCATRWPPRGGRRDV